MGLFMDKRGKLCAFIQVGNHMDKPTRGFRECAGIAEACQSQANQLHFNLASAKLGTGLRTWSPDSKTGGAS